MALIRQLQRLTLGRVEEFLASLAAAEMVYPQLLAELGEKVKAAANAEAKARTAVVSDERRGDERLEQSRRALEEASAEHARLREMVEHLTRDRYRVLARARLTRARRPMSSRETRAVPRPPKRLLDSM